MSASGAREKKKWRRGEQKDGYARKKREREKEEPRRGINLIAGAHRILDLWGTDVSYSLFSPLAWRASIPTTLRNAPLFLHYHGCCERTRATCIYSFQLIASHLPPKKEDLLHKCGPRRKVKYWNLSTEGDFPRNGPCTAANQLRTFFLSPFFLIPETLIIVLLTTVLQLIKGGKELG